MRGMRSGFKGVVGGITGQSKKKKKSSPWSTILTIILLLIAIFLFARRYL